MNHQIKPIVAIKRTEVLDISIADSKRMRAFIDKNGTIWFCLRDVITAMESKTEPSYAKQSVLDVFGDEVFTERAIADALGRKQKTGFINESATTYLIAQGRTEVSKFLNKHIHEEILPSIRKTGRYETPSNDSLVIRDNEEYVWTRKSFDLFEPAQKVATLLGLDKNAASISANNTCFKLTGISPMRVLEITHLEAEVQEVFLTPTDIGKQLETDDQKFSGIKVNKILEEMGLQEKIDAKTPFWSATEAGKKHMRLFDTGKQSNSGTPVMQMKWSESVIGIIKEHIDK